MNALKFTWGDLIRVSSSAPEECRPREWGAICGVPLPSKDTYTVEFGDGSSMEIPEKFLEKATNEHDRNA